MGPRVLEKNRSFPSGVSLIWREAPAFTHRGLWVSMAQDPSVSGVSLFRLITQTTRHRCLLSGMVGELD